MQVKRLDPGDQCCPGHEHLHLSEEFLRLVLLLGSGELQIREAELLAAHQLRTGQRLPFHRRAEGMNFPELHLHNESSISVYSRSIIVA